MKVYTDRKTAPLKFHKFLKWFSLPFGAFVSIGNVLLCFTDETAFTYYFDTGYYILYAILTIVSLVGMWRWKPYGPYSLYARQALDILNYCAVVIGYISVGRPLGKSLPNLVTSVIAAAIFWTYYQKRMPLFSKDVQPSSGGFKEKLIATLSSVAEVIANATGIVYVFIRFVIPLFPLIWFSRLFNLSSALFLIFSFFWHLAPVFCAPFWIYAIVFALSDASPFSDTFSVVAFVMGLLCILNKPICIFPDTIPVLAAILSKKFSSKSSTSVSESNPLPSEASELSVESLDSEPSEYFNEAEEKALYQKGLLMLPFTLSGDPKLDEPEIRKRFEASKELLQSFLDMISSGEIDPKTDPYALEDFTDLNVCAHEFNALLFAIKRLEDKNAIPRTLSDSCLDEARSLHDKIHTKSQELNDAFLDSVGTTGNPRAKERYENVKSELLDLSVSLRHLFYP